MSPTPAHPEARRAGAASPVAAALTLLAERGAARYGGEQVSQLEHALQCAALAEADGAAPELVAAALLHDVGHLLHRHGDDAAQRGVDDRHEQIGAGWLARGFVPAVAEPVRLHVPAKRYLCATDPAYFGALSAGSVRSLALQGGPLTPGEAVAFLAAPHAAEAVRLRRWDEAAKVPGAATPPLAQFRSLLARCLV
jgi:phosphonate degradation associated HDIG domain protein